MSLGDVKWTWMMRKSRDSKAAQSQTATAENA
jgi:hypothetical protein